MYFVQNSIKSADKLFICDALSGKLKVRFDTEFPGLPENNLKLARDHRSKCFRHDQLRRQQVLKQKKKAQMSAVCTKLADSSTPLTKTSKKLQGISKLIEIYQAKRIKLVKQSLAMNEKVATQAQLGEDCSQRLNAQTESLQTKSS